MHVAVDKALDHLSVTEKTAVFAMDLLRWVRGHTTCGSVLPTSESNLCCAPLAVETVSWGGEGWKKMNSWTDFLSLCCWLLGGKIANFYTQSELDGFVDIPHFPWMGFFRCVLMLVAAHVLFFVDMSGKLETGSSPVEVPGLPGRGELVSRRVPLSHTKLQ